MRLATAVAIALAISHRGGPAGQPATAAASDGSASEAAKASRPRKRRGAIPICRASGPATTCCSMPMERPEQFAGQSGAHRRGVRERAKRDQQALDRNKKAPSARSEATCGSRTFRQTSRVVEPADGRIPPTDRRRRERRVAPRQAARSNAPRRGRIAACTTGASPGELWARRCRSFTATATRSSRRPASVVINYEMMHDTRVIPLDGRPHVGSKHQDLPRRRARTLGGQYAGRRDDQLHGRQDGYRRQR